MEKEKQEQIDNYMKEFEDYLLKQNQNNHNYSPEQKKIQEQIDKYVKEFNNYIEKERQY
jgi:predicted DNA-binding protein